MVLQYEDTDGNRRFDPNVHKLLKGRCYGMLKSLPSADLVDCDGTTLLHICAKYEIYDLIRYLLIERNLDVNATNRLGETPLMWSIQHTHISLLHNTTWNILLDAGADLCRIKNNEGESAMMMIIQRVPSLVFSSNSKLIEYVEKRCANVAEVANALIDGGCQVCHLYVFRKAEITEQMLIQGCEVNARNQEGDTALHLAAKYHDLDNVKVLLRFGANKNIETFIYPPAVVNLFDTSMFKSNPDIELVKLLLPDDKSWLTRGINMDRIFTNCSAEMVELLLNRYDDFIDRRADFSTALHYLKAHKDKRIWELLKNVKLQVNVRDVFGRTALDEAMTHGNLEAVRIFLNAGAEVRFKDSRSPLLLFSTTSFHGNRKSGFGEYRRCVELVLQHGADPHLILRNGDSIVSHLMKKRHYAILDPILAQLAIDEARGLALNPRIISHINADRTLSESFVKYRRELDEMKRREIPGTTLTFFKFLIAMDIQTYKYAEHEEIVKELLQIEGYSYHHRLFINRLGYAMEMARKRKLVIGVINEYIKPLVGYRLVTDKILSYLNITDFHLIAGYD